MTQFYAGIGSRKTPADVQMLMVKIAEHLADQDYTLRSGHAEGADLAFEHGAGIMSEIYLPEPTFNQHYDIHGQRFAAPTLPAMSLAATIHPAWERCNQFARNCHARNMHQILGFGLDSPVKFVICWAPLDTYTGLPTGGTAQAVRLANKMNIPVFNLVNPEHRARLERFVSPVEAPGV